MLADPQAVTVNAVVISLPKTTVGNGQNGYVSADGLTSLTVKQGNTAARFRREIRISQQKIAADPISAVNKQIGTSVYLVIDEPRWGFTDAEIGYLIDALKLWSSSTNYNKVLTGEF